MPEIENGPIVHFQRGGGRQEHQALQDKTNGGGEPDDIDGTISPGKHSSGHDRKARHGRRKGSEPEFVKSIQQCR